MKVIGVTGGIGSGKSYVSNLFAELGCTVIDADAVSHEVMRRGGMAYEETVSAFGREILRPDGEIDRKALAGIVFSDRDKLELLNRITHRHIFRRMREQLAAAAQDGTAVLDVPLLFDADFPLHCDKTVAVLADLEVRIARVQKRDHTDRESVLRRIQNQRSDEEYRRLADVCVINNGDADALRRRVKEIYQSVRNENSA